ncbi:alcohol dehydrogenase catalytic domain-containing protein [Nocardia sp. NPDC002869]|uniref:alcohol dehydrogenase catalytic domain-containing protein n=1 Tax=Nocardia sp. NPDC002869 TaxID=3161032 RepID=UPI00398D2D92
MRALKLTGPHTVELVGTPVPEPGPGEIRIKVAGAGLCHSDLHVVHWEGELPYGFTLGHEGAGWVEAIGSEVTGHVQGQAVLVNLVWACGTCRACLLGRDNACMTAGRGEHPATPGLGPDGSMAEYMIVPARHALPLGGLDPVTAGPLADAALTPWHAIGSARDWLTPSSTAVVIGVGGLGHLGVQILAATTAARIIAVDKDSGKLDLARRHGAHHTVPADDAAAAAILAQTENYGADVVFDFVGVDPTMALAAAVVAPEGAIRFVGIGGGSLTYRAAGDATPLPWGVDIRNSYAGTRADLVEVIALAQRGHLHVEHTLYPLEEYQRAFDDLAAGRVSGRAIFTP